MSRRFALVAAFTSVHEAHFAQSTLEAAGIEVRIADEHTVSMDWTLSNAIGGVKVLVLEERVDEAKALLESSVVVDDSSLASEIGDAFVNDPFDLQRFVDAQARVYEQVLTEIRTGAKRSHWMWFIFPQYNWLGTSRVSRQYAIKSEEEARAYLRHPVLGARLIECTEQVLATLARSPRDVFGHPDDLKLRSSMTLFAAVSAPDSVFEHLLEKWFGGEPDDQTLHLLAEDKD